MSLRVLVGLCATIFVLAGTAFSVSTAHAQDDGDTGTLEFTLVACPEGQGALFVSGPGGANPSGPGDGCTADAQSVFSVVNEEDPSLAYTIDTTEASTLEVAPGSYLITDDVSGFSETGIVEANAPTSVFSVHEVSADDGSDVPGEGDDGEVPGDDGDDPVTELPDTGTGDTNSNAHTGYWAASSVILLALGAIATRTLNLVRP